MSSGPVFVRFPIEVGFDVVLEDGLDFPCPATFDSDFVYFLLLKDGFDVVLEDGLDVPCAAPSGGGGFAHTAAERVFLVVERVVTGILVV